MAVIDVEGIRHALDHARARARHAPCATAGSLPTARNATTGRTRSRPPPWPALAQEPGPGLPRPCRRRRGGSDLVRAQFAAADNMTDSLRGAAPARRDRDAGPRRGAGRVLRALAARAAGGQQVVRAAGRDRGRGGGRAGRGPAGAPGLHLVEPQPGARGAGRVRHGQPAGLPPPRRRRLPAAGRQGARARPPQPAGRRPPALGARPLAALRRRTGRR